MDGGCVTLRQHSICYRNSNYQDRENKKKIPSVI